MQYIIALVFISLLVFIYIGSYLLNKKVKVSIETDVSSCSACHSIGCANNPAHHKEDK